MNPRFQVPLNPELNRIKELVKWNGSWTEIISKWKSGIKTFSPRKKAFVVKRGSQRFITVAFTEAQAETQVA